MLGIGGQVSKSGTGRVLRAQVARFLAQGFLTHVLTWLCFSDVVLPCNIRSGEPFDVTPHRHAWNTQSLLTGPLPLFLQCE